MKKRRNRQISLNAFQPECDLSPYVENQQPMLTSFQISLLLMKLLKKHEVLTFANKEQEVKSTLDNLSKQNKMLNKIKQCGLVGKKRELISSFKVLEELDVNKKQAYKALEQQNIQIADRIYCLELALQRMGRCKKNVTLSAEYLQKLQRRVQDRKKIERHLRNLVFQLQNKNEQMYESGKKQIREWIQVNSLAGNMESTSEISNGQQTNKLSRVIQAIFNKLD